MSTIKAPIASRVRKLFAAFITGFLTTLLLTACQGSEEKVEAAREKVTDANQDLKEARRDARAEWQEQWLKFKRDFEEEITGNERRIIELRKTLNDVDTRFRADYGARVDEFERRNNELRDRVNSCGDEGDERWELFKRDITRDMDDLKSSLKNITIKNT